MKRKKLERMLHAVQDIKSQYYIGTSEAWDFLRSVENIYAIPEQIAQRINSRLG